LPQSFNTAFLRGPLRLCAFAVKCILLTAIASHNVSMRLFLMAKIKMAKGIAGLHFIYKSID
jgi:hypothetical protein